MTYSIIKKSQLEGASRIDAEYYQPEYLSIAKKLTTTKTLTLRNVASITPGPAYSSSQMGKDYDIPLVRIGDVTRKTNANSWIKLSGTEFKKYKNKKINNGDILMTMTGDPPDVGKCNIYKGLGCPAAYNQRVAKITPSINSYFLFAYLSTEFARLQCERNALGIRQRNVATDDIRNIKVILFNRENQNEIGVLVKRYLTELENSKKYYKQAEDLLLDKIGLKDFETKNDVYSIVDFSNIQKANRIDAEYFEKKYKDLELIINKHNAKKLGKLTLIKKGIEPGGEEYQEKGKQFVRVSSLSKEGINNNDQKYLSDDVYQKLKNNFEPKVGEILITKDATPGIAYVIKKKIDGIISSGILRLELKKNIEPEYLALVINSIVGQLQAERDAGGSIIKHWKPEQIKQILIPILPKPTQKKIADLVRKSHSARQKAKELLREAKNKVEKLIEKGEN